MPGYGDDTGFNGWLTDNGYALPVGAPAAAVLRQRGSTYLDATYGSRFVGYPTGGAAQERAWPRTSAYALGSAIDPAVIPAAVIEASYQAAWYEANNSGGLVVGGASGKAVKREKVDVIEVEYATAASQADYAASLTPLISTVEGLLAPFLTRTAPGVWVV